MIGNHTLHLGECISVGTIKEAYGSFPIALCRQQHVLLIADNSSTSILLYAYCISHRIPVILIDSKIKRKQTEEHIRCFNPYWLFYPLCQEKYGSYCAATEWNGYMLSKRKETEEDKNFIWREDLALLLPTSGSTGGSKFAMLSYTNLLSNAECIIQSLHIKKDDRAALLLPISYAYGLSVVNSYLLAGGTLLVPYAKIYEKECWDFIEQEHVNAICGVPYSYKMYRKLHIFHRELSDLRLMTQAGGALDDETKQFLLKEANVRNIKFAVMYGQTEATARISSFFLNLHPEKFGSVGKVIPEGALSIRDMDGEGFGEIVYEGKNVFLGYAEGVRDMCETGDDSSNTHRKLFTGDIGYMDADGFLYITGRKKRFVKIYGNRINLDDLQRKLGDRLAHPVICIGGNDNDEEMVWVIEEKKQYQREMTCKILWNFPELRDRWRAFQVESIPINVNGKTDYQQLAKYCKE